MTYASANRRPNPAAMIGALGIPGAFGVLLVAGLAVTVVTVPKAPNPKATPIAQIPLPPPPPADPKPRDKVTQKDTTITNTKRIDMLPVDLGKTDTVITLPLGGDLTGPLTGPIDLGIPGPTPSASPFTPVGAVPRGNPGKWVTDADYRTRWINEGLSGSARFTLAIDARGGVTNCSVTRSTGHAVLDAATCQLVTRRARFDPARDSTGKPVAGSYNGSINWKIPE
ncbi:TonB family protein [Porphyrobacter sp. LM 6]|uniref:TonB family protein n=1 Tax=Porphyrobacter sp. LM 6 TaxID=1896196 RepID=UPI000846CD63|nr:TonB family protein [Porphyrobacter sp. LM 6]AOL94297.1 protein TonB [Porphyrobacter sp. LM 6]